MSSRDPRRDPDRYEVLVVGPVGPVLRRALQPWLAGSGQSETIIRARARAGADLVDVAARFVESGATITEITLLPDAPGRQTKGLTPR